MKGVFEKRPSLPRYTHTWDVNIVLKFLQSLPQTEQLELKKLTLKLVTLLTILPGQRCQTIHFVDIQHMHLDDKSVTFHIEKLVKQSKHGRHISKLEFSAYTPDDKLYVVNCVKENIKRSEHIRGKVTQLFVSYVKTFGAVSKETIRRWIKTVLSKAGINTDVFKQCWN